MSFVPRALARSVFCASTCSGTSAEATPTNTAQMNASFLRSVMTIRQLRSGGVRDLRGLRPSGHGSRLTRRRGRKNHHGLTVGQKSENRPQHNHCAAQPDPFHERVEVRVNYGERSEEHTSELQ